MDALHTLGNGRNARKMFKTKVMNAQVELLERLEFGAKIKCASIQYGDGYFTEPKCMVLKLNYSENEYEAFLKSLDFNYDHGYGMQYLYGTVWLEDGTWLSRGEYDGSEWWEHNMLPEIPEECLKQK